MVSIKENAFFILGNERRPQEKRPAADPGFPPRSNGPHQMFTDDIFDNHNGIGGSWTNVQRFIDKSEGKRAMS